MSERVIGYILLSVGLIIMFLSVISIVLVLTNRMKPIGIAGGLITSEANNPNFNITNFLPNQGSLQNQQALNIATNLLSSPIFSNFGNLIIHYLLMSFLVGFGYKLASLGVMLLRPIKVKLKSDGLTDVLSQT